jgi:chitinase
MKTSRRSVLALGAGTAAAWAVGSQVVGAEPPVASSPFRVVGYLPDYRMDDYNLTDAIGVTDLVAFSADPTELGEIDLTRLEKAPWARLREFKTRNRIRLILSVGGWERSAGFASASSTAERRERFADAAVRLCLEMRLDGLDLDWEHPANKEEAENYASLLAATKKAFVPQGLQLSATMAAWQPLDKRAFEAVDTLHVMAYDHDDRHSTFDNAKADCDKLIAAGVRPEKLVLGFPFYGRHRTDRSKSLTFKEIAAKGKFDPNQDEAGDIYYNGPAMIRRKTRYAIDSKFAGVMFWELGQDASGEKSLLSAIQREIAAK